MIQPGQTTPRTASRADTAAALGMEPISGDPADPAVSRSSDTYNKVYKVSTAPFAMLGKLLPATMLGIIPALILLYITSLLDVPLLYTAAACLTIVLMAASSIMIVIATLLALADYVVKTHHLPLPYRK